MLAVLHVRNPGWVGCFVCKVFELKTLGLDFGLREGGPVSVGTAVEPSRDLIWGAGFVK